MYYAFRAVAALAVAASLSACATAPHKIRAANVPAEQFAALDCSALEAKMADNGERSGALRQRIAKRNKSDKIVTGVGVVVAWPALFFIKGNGKVKKEYAHLLGEKDALARNAADKGCAVPTAETA